MKKQTNLTHRKTPDYLEATIRASSANAAVIVPPYRGKVLMPLGDATETMDTYYAYYRIPEDGYEVVVAGPEKRLYHTVMHEIPPNSDVKWDITRESPGYHIEAKIAFRDVNPEDYAGLFVSGGRAPEYLRYDKDLLRIVRAFHKAKKPIASLCHGIEILTAADIIQGRKICTVPKCKLDVEQGGGIFPEETFSIDGHFVSCCAHVEMPLLLKNFVAMLNAQTAGKRFRPS